MSHERFLIDTSALMALIEDEAGADQVEQIITEENALLPWPVLLELYYITRQEHGQAEADRRYAMATRLGAEVLWQMDEPLLLTAAQLKTRYRISFADALIAAFAVREKAALVHKDPEYDVLDGFIPLVRLPYKTNE